MIKGKRKNLPPDENLDSIMAANAGLTAWRIKRRRPRRRVTIAYYLNDPKLWAEFEWRRRIVPDGRGQFRSVSMVTYRRQAERPIGGFIANGKTYTIERLRGEITRVSYMFESGKTVGVPDDIMVAFQKVWNLNVDKNLINNAYDDWMAKNMPAQPGKVLAVKG